MLRREQYSFKKFDENSWFPIEVKDEDTQTAKNKKACCFGRMGLVRIGSLNVGYKTLYRTQRILRHRPKLMNWLKYQKLKVIYDFMDDLEIDYPAICSVVVIGTSVEGRDIKVLKISNTNASNTPVWLDGTMHSREWIGTAAVTYIANIIAKNFAKLPAYITNKDWYFVPVVNPDGYNYTHQSRRAWRKNRKKLGPDCYGVDLNRNFSYQWGLKMDENSASDDPRNFMYQGPKPFSEPESTAVKNFILSATKPFKVFLTFHSAAQAITIPYSYTEQPCPHYSRLMEAGALMSKAIYKTSGQIYKVGTFRDILYCATGTSLDWSYGRAMIPFSFLIELRKVKSRFNFVLPWAEIVGTCEEAAAAVEVLMEYVDQPPENELRPKISNKTMSGIEV